MINLVFHGGAGAYSGGETSSIKLVFSSVKYYGVVLDEGCCRGSTCRVC